MSPVSHLWPLAGLNTFVFLVIYSMILGNTIHYDFRRLDKVRKRSTLKRLVLAIVVVFRTLAIFTAAFYFFAFLIANRVVVVALYKTRIPQAWQSVVFVAGCFGCGFALPYFKNSHQFRCSQERLQESSQKYGMQGYYGLLELAFAETAAYFAYTGLINAPQDNSTWMKLVAAVYFCARGFENCWKGRVLEKLFRNENRGFDPVRSLSPE